MSIEMTGVAAPPTLISGDNSDMVHGSLSKTLQCLSSLNLSVACTCTLSTPCINEGLLGFLGRLGIGAVLKVPSKIEL